MTSRTAWTAGNGAGLTWASAFNAADLNSLPNGSGILSSVADIANGTALDMFMDISAFMTIAVNTISPGANLAFWIYQLQEDGASYGDGQFGAGSAGARTPAFSPCGVIPLVALNSQTNLIGSVQQIIIPPGSFRLVVQNNSGWTLASSGNAVKYRTYNINMNN